MNLQISLGFLYASVLPHFSVDSVLGGESQQGRLSHISGCSANAYSIGKPSYLEPNSNSLQKSIEGVLWLLAFSAVNGMLEKPRRTYLEPNSNRMQKPVEGLSAPRLNAL